MKDESNPRTEDGGRRVSQPNVIAGRKVPEGGKDEG